jgi:hypothetical protein
MSHSVLRRVMSRLRPAPISARAPLKAFLEERSLLIAQKCAIDYCRGKTGLASYALFTEEPFLQALDVCRWETHAAVLSDLLVLLEGHLRPHAPAAHVARLGEALARLYREILEAPEAPAHRPNGWGDACASFAARLQGIQAAAPLGPAEIADYSAKRLFDTLPIHSNHRELDEEVVYGAVRFRMIAVNQELRTRIAAERLSAELLA